MSIHRYYTLTLSEKMLYTSFLLLIGLGYLMATPYLYVTHEMNDGKPGLSIEDIASNYYGNRSGTPLQAAIRGPMSEHIENDDMNLPDFSTYEGLHKYAQVDTGMSMTSLLKLSHIHLFGISMLLFVLGYIFIQSEINVYFKRFLVVSPMVAVLGFSMAAQILISLYQIWFLKRPAHPELQPPLK